jgi:hypothetical protein
LGLWWVLGEQIIQLCKTSFCAFYRFLGGVDPTGAYILACPHLTRLQKFKLLLDACLLLLAPRDETIRCRHGALREFTFSEQRLSYPQSCL